MIIDYAKFFERVEHAATFLKAKIKSQPQIVIVLTGGLGDFVKNLSVECAVSFKDIPYFEEARAEGHEGKIVFGTFKGLSIAAMQGRFHYYEGHHPAMVVFPHFVMGHLGARILITTNAVGGIRHDLNPGDIILITDHINMMGTNPLIGIAIQREKDQFTSLVNAYDSALTDTARRVARAQGMALKEGVFAAVSGPTYETKAEVRSLRTLGADAVGMSTVPEVIAANFLHMKVLSLSCVANAAADRHGGEMTHDEVLREMNAAAPKLVSLLTGIVEDISAKKICLA